MENEYVSLHEADLKHWNNMLKKSQWIMAVSVLAIEIAANFLLLKGEAQGYSAENFQYKIFRYLILTTLINFSNVFLSRLIIRLARLGYDVAKYVLMTSVILLCANISFSHYQFACVFPVFAIPIMMSVLYEIKGFSVFSTVLSLAAVSPGIISRIKRSAVQLGRCPGGGHIIYVYRGFRNNKLLYRGILVHAQRNAVRGGKRR